ncbi:MAG: hypothetical protein U9O89_03850 [Thermoproteota archaeon]|nr:hypothetical protein [Thermoproteota archaeon]
MQETDGGLILSLGEKADLNNAFLIKCFIELNIQNVAEDFKTYILKRQNVDGGWGKYREEPSVVSVTANVVKGLVDVDVSCLLIFYQVYTNN